MALIPVYHVVPSYYPVDPDYDAVNSPIIMGMFVTLQSNGYVAKANATNAIGIAGDSIATDSGYTPYAADIVISGNGATRSTSNRVSDFFDETRGSGKLTVYHSGGEFWTDQYESSIAADPPAAVYSSANALLDDSGSVSVGRLIEGPTDYPSGVPGTDTQGSISLGQYIRFKLSL
tara:strand:+ start:260887 stop:261414 length:528 start_codon:yes stop_codon:yes gene_type:complete